MKIGVIGPDSTVNIIRAAAERDIPDVRFLYACTDFFEKSGQLADELQRDPTIDAILFSGPTNWNYALRRVTPTVPWGYIPHSRTAALQALLTAQSLYGSKLKNISVDRYDPQMLKLALSSCGIHDSAIYQAPYDAEHPDFEKKLLEFHRDCYRRKLVSICITSMEHIQAPLLEEGIPCIRTVPADEVIREQIYHLQLRHFSARENSGKLAVIAVRFDFSSNEKKSLSVREWDKMRCQGVFQEKIYAIAQQMEAAVFNMGMGYFFVVSSRDMLMNIFFKNGEHCRLIQTEHRKPEYQVWIGIGIGSTMVEAKSRAVIALNHSVADKSGGTYLVEDERHGLEKLNTADMPSAKLSSSDFSQRADVSAETAARLRRALKQGGDSITSAELAARMGITTRSVNRILSSLEEAGYVATVGKRSSGKGRPARVMKISLPE